MLQFPINLQCLIFLGNEGFEKMSSSKIAESDSGAEDDIAPAYMYVILISMFIIIQALAW